MTEQFSCKVVELIMDVLNYNQQEFSTMRMSMRMSSGTM